MASYPKNPAELHYQLLIRVDGDLGDSHLPNLKQEVSGFDQIGAARLEKCESFLDVLEYMESTGLIAIGEYGNLKDVLKRLHHDKVLKKVQSAEEEIQTLQGREPKKSKQQSFRTDREVIIEEREKLHAQLINELDLAMEKKDLRQLKTAVKGFPSIHTGELERCEKALHVLQYLNRTGVIGVARYEKLRKVFRELNLRRLLDIIADFEERLDGLPVDPDPNERCELIYRREDEPRNDKKKSAGSDNATLLQKEWYNLVKNLEIDDVRNILISKLVLSSAQIEDLKAMPVRRTQVEYILEILLRKPDEDIEHFWEALRETDQERLLPKEKREPQH